MNYQAAIAARNKDIARELFTKYNVPSPKYKAVKTYDEAKKFIDLTGYPVVLKPTNAASSQFVMLISDQLQLASAFNELYGF